MRVNSAVRMVERRVEGIGTLSVHGSSVSASSVRRGLLSILVGKLKYFIDRIEARENMTGLDMRNL